MLPVLMSVVAIAQLGREPFLDRQRFAVSRHRRAIFGLCVLHGRRRPRARWQWPRRLCDRARSRAVARRRWSAAGEIALEVARVGEVLQRVAFRLAVADAAWRHRACSSKMLSDIAYVPLLRRPPRRAAPSELISIVVEQRQAPPRMSCSRCSGVVRFDQAIGEAVGRWAFSHELPLVAFSRTYDKLHAVVVRVVNGGQDSDRVKSSSARASPRRARGRDRRPGTCGRWRCRSRCRRRDRRCTSAGLACGRCAVALHSER